MRDLFSDWKVKYIKLLEYACWTLHGLTNKQTKSFGLLNWLHYVICNRHYYVIRLRNYCSHKCPAQIIKKINIKMNSKIL